MQVNLNEFKMKFRHSETSPARARNGFYFFFFFLVSARPKSFLLSRPPPRFFAVDPPRRLKLKTHRVYVSPFIYNTVCMRRKPNN